MSGVRTVAFEADVVPVTVRYFRPYILLQIFSVNTSDEVMIVGLHPSECLLRSRLQVLEVGWQTLV